MYTPLFERLEYYLKCGALNHYVCNSIVIFHSYLFDNNSGCIKTTYAQNVHNYTKYITI